MAVGLLGAGVSYAEAFAATLVLNSRHIFYGLSVLVTIREGFVIGTIFGLTDETYH